MFDTSVARIGHGDTRSSGIPAVGFGRARREQEHVLAHGGAGGADLVPHLALQIEADQRAAPFEGVRQDEADALAGAGRAIDVDVARARIAHVPALIAAEEHRVTGLAVQQVRRASGPIAVGQTRSTGRRTDAAEVLRDLENAEADPGPRDQGREPRLLRNFPDQRR